MSAKSLKLGLALREEGKSRSGGLTPGERQGALKETDERGRGDEHDDLRPLRVLLEYGEWRVPKGIGLENRLLDGAGEWSVRHQAEHWLR